MKITTTIKRLEQLAKFMESIPPKEFDFTLWWRKNEEIKCGFTACALGWACYVPEFKKLGLRLRKPDCNYYGTPMLIRHGKRVASDLEAAQIFFGISSHLAQVLFTPDAAGSPSHEITPQEWAIHARKIIKRLKKKHGITAIKQRPQSFPLVRKLSQAELPVLPGILRNPASDRPDAVLSKSAPSDRFAYSEQQPSSG